MGAAALRFAALLASVGLCAGAFAQASTTDPQPPALAWEGSYKFDVLSLASGGVQRGASAMGHLDLKLAADLDTAWGWSGTTAFFNLLHDHGDRFNRDRVGSLTGSSNIEVPVDTERLFQAWIQKEWHSDSSYALLAGLYPIDTEFQVLDTAALFLHPSHGASGDVSLTRGPSIFNNSALGVRGRWVSGDRRLYLQAAVLDGIPGDPNQPKGTHAVWAQSDGTMGIVETGWRPTADKHLSETKFAAGAWGYSAQVDDLRDVDANGLPAQRRSAGAYVLAEGKLWQGTDASRLYGFVRYAATDGDSTPIRAIVNTGLVIRAPFEGRPHDTVGLAYTHAVLGDKYRATQEAMGRATTATEAVWEFTYRIKPGDRLAVQPVVQWFSNPGAYQAVQEATVVGLRVEVSF